MSINIRSLGLCVALAAAPFASSAAGAVTLGTNVVVNGDAETGGTGGFVTTGDLEARAYGGGGGYPGAGDPGAAQGGGYFFDGGVVGVSTGTQGFDLSGNAAAIDLGQLGYSLSALLGGYASQGDNAVLGVQFLSATGGSLGSGMIGPVTAADRMNVTGLLARSASGAVPIGTRSATLTLTLTRTDGYANDGYADNLSLIFNAANGPTALPEPATWAMMIAGFGAVGAALRRRRAAPGIA